MRDEAKSSELATVRQLSLYPSLDPSQAQASSASNACDDLPEERSASRAGRPEGGETAHTLRLHKTNEILNILEAWWDKRACLAKKYQQRINVLSGLSDWREVATIDLGTAGVALLTTIVAAPVVIVMEGVALASGEISVLFYLICDKILSSKAWKYIRWKYIRIMMLAEAKMNTVSDHIS